MEYLVAVDGSESSTHALEHAIEFATRADAAGVDGVVVGHLGLSGQVARMVGSVAKGLVENATIPVTVVQ